jgi:hypothetical protein
VSQGVDLLSGRKFLSGVSQSVYGSADHEAQPSPTSNWYSGPVGVVRMLFVSSIGGAWPAATAALYAAWVGYLGGGGKTLPRCQRSIRVEPMAYSQHDGRLDWTPDCDRMHKDVGQSNNKIDSVDVGDTAGNTAYILVVTTAYLMAGLPNQATANALHGVEGCGVIKRNVAWKFSVQAESYEFGVGHLNSRYIRPSLDI